MPEPDRRAFLDANVLRGALQTDVLLTLAFRDEFQPRWNAEVMDEVRRNRPPGLSEAAIDRRLGQMNAAFPQAMVQGYEHLEPAMQADPKDKHVLAAAVHSRSTVLVTENVKDFSPPTTGPHAMPVQRLSKFLSDLTRENPARMVDAMRDMVGRNQREPNTVSALIDKMATLQDLRGFAQTLNSVVPEQDRGTDPRLAESQREAVVLQESGAGVAQSTGPGVAQEATRQGPDEQAQAAKAIALDGVAGVSKTSAPRETPSAEKNSGTGRGPQTPERER
ncbi:hypothetical protein BWI15_09290 [Kribbella sp. ALI-6-A]|uniref:PIN domain-containing protein n=1 Tax=Kribbella sp. ALI-6-A TaxID=1933817 RepID=UPI00097BC0A9|nr:PIN domain-containing protein [Kribbella sp. ALI-6-A]ONI73624.1 hypothetical protein BWI15_09290 [Kribbella sp. ALI-6-A]